MSEKTEYFRWDEYNWKNPDMDWKDGKAITGGVDVGSRVQRYRLWVAVEESRRTVIGTNTLASFGSG